MTVPFIMALGSALRPFESDENAKAD